MKLSIPQQGVSLLPAAQIGFTVAEIIVATVVVGSLLVPVSMVMLQFYGQAVANSRNTHMAIESREVLSVISENLRISSAVLAKNAISDTNSPAGGWATNASTQVLVISTVSFNKVPEMVFNTSTGKYYQDEIVFYVSGKELRRRYLANTNAADNRQKTTCPPEISSPACPPDLVLSRSLTAFSFTLYDTLGAETSVASNTRSVKATTEITAVVYGRSISYKDTALLALRNPL